MSSPQGPKVGSRSSPTLLVELFLPRRGTRVLDESGLRIPFATLLDAVFNGSHVLASVLLSLFVGRVADVALRHPEVISDGPLEAVGGVLVDQGEDAGAVRAVGELASDAVGFAGLRPQGDPSSLDVVVEAFVVQGLVHGGVAGFADVGEFDLEEVSYCFFGVVG